MILDRAINGPRASMETRTLSQEELGRFLKNLFLTGEDVETGHGTAAVSYTHLDVYKRQRDILRRFQAAFMISERLYFFMLVTSWGCPLLMILLYANILSLIHI